MGRILVDGGRDISPILLWRVAKDIGLMKDLIKQSPPL